MIERQKCSTRTYETLSHKEPPLQNAAQKSKHFIFVGNPQENYVRVLKIVDSLEGPIKWEKHFALLVHDA